MTKIVYVYSKLKVPITKTLGITLLKSRMRYFISYSLYLISLIYSLHLQFSQTGSALGKIKVDMKEKENTQSFKDEDQKFNLPVVEVKPKDISVEEGQKVSFLTFN